MNQSGKIAVAILAVAAIAGFTVLLTTDQGKKTRKKIAKKGQELWDKAKEAASDLAEEASDFADKVVKQGEDLV